MLFHKFDTQEERSTCGGSAFIEMQFCRMPAGTDIKTLVAVDSMRDWLNDSLYISDENLFYEQYSRIFDCGVYNNLKSGPVDIYGINYYGPELVDAIIYDIMKEKPVDYELLVQWLEKSKGFNGFYILGI